MNLDVERYLESLSARYSRHYRAVISDLIVAQAHGDKPAAAKARATLSAVISETMGIAEVVGAATMLRAAAGAMNFRESVTLADVTFSEAVEDLVSRAPSTLRNAAERTAQNISRLYSEGRVMAFAKSAEQAVTERVQALIVQAVRDGIPEASAGTLIRMGVDEVRQATEAWTEAYARMAFRTNVNTAVTAGRFRQAQDTDVKKVVPAFRFDAVGDADTRDNHEAADGMILAVDNLAWNRIAPPLGFNCRCQVSLVTRPELRRMGRLREDGSVIESAIPQGAFPDPGFRHTGRPDLFITGAA